MCDVDNWFSRFSGTSTDNIDEKLTSYLALVFYYSDTMAGMVKGLRQFHLSYLPFFRCQSFCKGCPHPGGSFIYWVHVTSLRCNTIHLTLELILCVQITRWRVEFNTVESPRWHQVSNLWPSDPACCQSLIESWKLCWNALIFFCVITIHWLTTIWCKILKPQDTIPGPHFWWDLFEIGPQSPRSVF